MIVRNDGGPAFPVLDEPHFTFGMSLRDWFAGQALAALGTWTPLPQVENLWCEAAYKARADLAYGQADAMLAARNKEADNPLQAELDEAKAKIEHLEQLRPHWAQGYSSDSIAAQTATSALSSLWALLGVPHQTAAVARLRRLVGKEAS